MESRIVPLLVLAGMTAVGPLSAQASPALEQAAATITAEDISRHIHVIADDSMQGRATPSPGLEKTARYVAEQFKRFGLKPGGDNHTWFQRFKPSEDDTATVPNTIGILEGSDPKLKDEYVVFSAHMDHLGIGSDATDSIYNGANDDGSGTVGIIELAKAFSQSEARPRRSIIFLTVSGEEVGLLGSQYFTTHPPVPLQQIVADLNFDMIGRWTTDTLLVVGLEHSDLGATFNRVSAEHPDVRMAPIPNPPPGRLYSSDHFNFARRGVPILKFGGPDDRPGRGGNDDYHEPSDSPDKIETAREARILRFAFFLGQAVANADQRPQWNPESYKAIVGK